MEPPKRLIERIFEFCITIAVCAFLLKIAMYWLAEVAPLLLLCAAFILGVVLGYRLWKHLRDLGKW